jgi:KUP system potassium uptake protein
MVFFHLHPVETPSVSADERYAVSRFTAIPGCYRLVVKHGFMDEVISPDLAALIYEQLRKFVIRQASYRAENLVLEKEKLERDEHREEEVDGDEKAQHGQSATSATENEPVAEMTRRKRTSSEQKSQSANIATFAMTSPQTDSTTATASSRSRPGVSEASTLETPSAGGGTKTPLSPTLPFVLNDEHASAELARLDRAFAAKILYVVGKEQMKIRASTGLARRVALSIFLWIRDNTRAKIANLRLAMERVVEVGFVKDI